MNVVSTFSSIIIMFQLIQKRPNGVAAFCLPSHNSPYRKSLAIRSFNGKVPLEEPSTFPDWSFEPRDFFRYELIYQSKVSNARVGRIHTPHGTIDTPGFVAVATNGALKGLDMRDADAAGQQLVFCNSYHLMLQPGPEIIQGKVLMYCDRVTNLLYLFRLVEGM